MEPFQNDVIERLDTADELVHLFEGDRRTPDVLYIKLKSSTVFDEKVRDKAYNRQGFLGSFFGDKFSFDPQFSTAKLDYDFAEHRNLSDLGTFAVKEAAADIKKFVRRSK